MIHDLMAKRRRLLMAMTMRGGSSGAFEFSYTGDFTDVTENGQRVITLTSSGTFTALSEVVAQVFMQGAGGGCACRGVGSIGTGGGGGYMTFVQALTLGAYDAVVGLGGAGAKAPTGSPTGGTGGSTSMFGNLCTGGTGGKVTWQWPSAGTGGTPNGGDGITEGEAASSGVYAGGAPNGGSYADGVAEAGGDGYITITIPAA